MDTLAGLGTKPSTTRTAVDIKGIVFIFSTIQLALAARDASYYSTPQMKNSVLQTRETAGKINQGYKENGKKCVHL